MHALNERFEMRLDQDTLQAIDAWRSQQPDLPGRSEAARRLMGAGLAAIAPGQSESPLTFTPVETLQTHLLCQILKAVQPKAQKDANFVQGALFSGNVWAIRSESPGLVDNETADLETVRVVGDTLQMWDFIEDAYANLGPKDRARVAKEADPFGKNPKFEGYDGNEEGEYLCVVQFMVKVMGRFDRFAERDLNSHSASVERYQRMLAVFRPLRRALLGRRLSADQLVAILKAQTHPAHRKNGDS